MYAVSSLFLVLVTVTSILAQCPPQASISNSPVPVPTGQAQLTPSPLFINHTIAEQSESGLVKDAIISIVNVQCNDIVITGLSGTFGDGITWGTIVNFVINTASSIPSMNQTYNDALKLPLPNKMTNVVQNKFPANGASVTAIPASALTSFFINSQATTIRQSHNGQIVVIGQDNQNSTGVASQPCVVSGWSDCDGCKKDKSQIVTRTVTKPAVGGGSCPPTQMLVYCNRKCLTDWQIGLIALACFLFLVCVCICLYCVCVRRRPTHDPAKERAQQKANELATPPPVDEKIDVDVVDPVRPSTAGLDEPANFHRASSETGTGPRPTATFHDDDEPAETKPTPTPQEEAKSAEPEPVPVAAPPTGAPRANVVRVHL